MEEKIVSGLFGISPEQLMRQRQATDASNAFKFAQLDPLEQAKFAIYQGSAGLGRGIQGLLGGDPELERVSQIKQMSSQFDLTTAAGMREFARALQQVAPQEAMMAAKRADEMDLGAQQRATQRSQELRNLREPTRTAFSQLVASGKYTPASLALYEKSQDPADLVLVEKKAKGDGSGDGAGVAGPVGKSGAYRDADGIVYSATEMAKQRAGFQGLEKLADNLNAITTDDIKNAESFFDYTQGETLKTIGGKVSPKTISAQAKINASQLLKQIESLPPGSASNADMIAAKSSFPGYGNAGNLETWVKNTKQLLADSMQRQVEQYGFKQKVQVKGLDGAVPEAKPTAKTRKLKSGVVVTVEDSK